MYIAPMRPRTKRLCWASFAKWQRSWPSGSARSAKASMNAGKACGQVLIQGVMYVNFLLHDHLLLTSI